MTNRKRSLVPLTGIAFVVFFIASVLVSTVPNDSASDKDWVAAYASSAKQTQHHLTGILLLLAGLSLMSFLTHLWTRVGEASQPEAVSPLPVVSAGVAAACIAVGGVLMAGVAHNPLPGADVLRLGNDIGFVMVGVAGMLVAALSVACVSVQARSAGIFGTGMMRFSLVVAVLLLASFAFLPILALLIWLIVVAVKLMRSPTTRRPANLEHDAVVARI